MPEKPSVLFLFPHPATQVAEETRLGIQPSERIYGVNELTARGWRITVSDARFGGIFGRAVEYLRRYGVNVFEWATLRQIFAHDIVVVKDDFSVPLSLACRLSGKKIVYYDSMFQLPRRSFSRHCVAYCLRHCDAVLSYSDVQIALWQREFELPRKKFHKIPYAMDVPFYLRRAPVETKGGYVLSIGRDPGRDFKTLVRACRQLRMPLKLVTLDYLVKDIGLPDEGVEVIQNVSYETLFDLYAMASVVALPLKGGITYPSGIRAALECLLNGTPLVATRTEVLGELLDNFDWVYYAHPEDADDLAVQIQRAALSTHGDNIDTSSRAAALVPTMTELGRRLDEILSRL